MRSNPLMRKSQVCLWDEDAERLERIAAGLQIPTAELWRRAMDVWLECRGDDPLGLVERRARRNERKQ